MFPDRSIEQFRDCSRKKRALRPVRTRDAKEGPRLSSNYPENKRLILIIDPRRNLCLQTRVGIRVDNVWDPESKTPSCLSYDGVIWCRLAPEPFSKD